MPGPRVTSLLILLTVVGVACQAERSQVTDGVATEAYAAVVTGISERYAGEAFVRVAGSPEVTDLLASRGFEVANEMKLPFCPGELRVWFDSAHALSARSYAVHASIAGAGVADLEELEFTVDCAESRCQVVGVNPLGQAEVSLNVDSIGCRGAQPWNGS